MAKKTKKDETTNNNQQQNIVKKTIATQHFNYVTPSFSYRTEHCSNPSKFLVREKTHTRTYDTLIKFLYQDSRTSFLYKKLGPSAISIKQIKSAKFITVASHITNNDCNMLLLFLRLVKHHK